MTKLFNLLGFSFSKRCYLQRKRIVHPHSCSFSIIITSSHSETSLVARWYNLLLPVYTQNVGEINPRIFKVK